MAYPSPRGSTQTGMVRFDGSHIGLPADRAAQIAKPHLIRHPGLPGALCWYSLWKIHLQFLHSLARGIQASDFEGGMTVSGPSSSRMTRRRGAGGFSWYW